MPTNPYWLMQRSISGMQFFGDTRALSLHLELAALDGLADLVIRHCRTRRRRLAGGMRLDLLLPPSLVLAGGGGVVAVAVNDHEDLRVFFSPLGFSLGRGKHLARRSVNRARWAARVASFRAGTQPRHRSRRNRGRCRSARASS